MVYFLFLIFLKFLHVDDPLLPDYEDAFNLLRVGIRHGQIYWLYVN